MDPYPFWLFLVASDPTYGKNTTSKAFHHLGYFPGKCIGFFEIMDNNL